MPELPEAETIRRDLERIIVGKIITDVNVIKPKVIKEPPVERFKKEIKNASVNEIIRRGKALIVRINQDKYLIIHLRISGWLLYGKPAEKARVVFIFSGADALNYMDQRLLGEIKLRSSYRDLAFIRNLGPEFFSLTEGEFKNIIKNQKRAIKIVLMDQRAIAGLGNIYAQESLYRARILPGRRANDLKDKEIGRLYKKIEAVLKEAIKYRGSSVDAYKDIAGHKGGMESRLKVYGRKGKPCVVCKTPIKKIKIGGRGTCFCPVCQK